MAEITKKRRGELVRKVFETLLEHPEGLPAREVLAHVEQSLPLTEFEKSTYPGRPNVRRFEKIVRFSTITAVKAGWLIKDKGQWVLTDDGKKAYQEFKEPEKFEQEAVRLYRQWRKQRGDEDEGSEDEPGVVGTLEEAEEAAWTEINQYVQKMPPFEFQRLVAVLLRAMGYHVSWEAPPGRDAGIDIIAHTDPLGVRSPRIKVQVKRRPDNKVNVDELRSFMAVLGPQDVGIYVSSGGFTSDAEAEARSQPARQVTLMDVKRLFDLWIEFYEKIPDDDKQLLLLKPVHYLAPAE